MLQSRRRMIVGSIALACAILYVLLVVIVDGDVAQTIGVGYIACMGTVVIITHWMEGRRK